MGIGSLVSSLPKVSNVTLVLAVMAVVASAGLVAYISNQVTAQAVVSSPISLTVTEASIVGGQTWTNPGNTLDFGAVYGSDVLKIKGEAKNNAQNPVSGYAELRCYKDAMSEVSVKYPIPGASDVLVTKTVCPADGWDYYYVSGPTAVSLPPGVTPLGNVKGTIATTYVGAVVCQFQMFPDTYAGCGAA